VPNHIVDLTGKRVNKLQVAWPVGSQSTNWKSPHKRILWLCFCDCGNTKLCTTSELNRKCKTRNFRSCGCARRNPETSFHTLWVQYKLKARNNGHVWKLTYEQFKKLVTSPCHYTGWAPEQLFKPQGLNPSPSLLYNGIDRVNNTKGYLPSNCVPCAGPVNKAKLTMTKKRFIEMCCAVVKLHGGKENADHK